MVANFASAEKIPDQEWLTDSVASHHVTNELEKLLLASTDEGHFTPLITHKSYVSPVFMHFKHIVNHFSNTPFHLFYTDEDGEYKEII